MSSVPEMRQDEEVLGVYDRLIAFSGGLPNDDLLACMLATRACGGGALPMDLGLGSAAYGDMLTRHFRGAECCQRETGPATDPERQPESEDLYRLLIDHRAGADVSEQWLAHIVAAGCMGSDHLWQDLGLWSRVDLSALMTTNFPLLAARNDRDMKWKKFLYRQLCVQEGIYTCRSPTCETCADYALCFGPED